MTDETTPTPAVPTETKTIPVTVRQFKPSQLLEYARGRDDIAELIRRGYDVPDDERTDQEVLEDQYDLDEDRATIYLAESDGKIVGSLYFIHWKNQDTDKRGRPLAEYLSQHGSDLIDLSKIKPGQTIACDIDIVIHPDFRSHGIAKQLYTKALETTDPVFLVGQTKTAAAPVSRERALRPMGFVTFYGGLPVNESDPSANPEIGQFTADMYLEVRKDRATRVGNLNIHYDPADDILQPDINVDMDRLPPNVRTVFGQIIEADKARPDGQICFGVLVSVNKNYLKPSE